MSVKMTLEFDLAAKLSPTKLSEIVMLSAALGQETERLPTALQVDGARVEYAPGPGPHVAHTETKSDEQQVVEEAAAVDQELGAAASSPNADGSTRKPRRTKAQIEADAAAATARTLAAATEANLVPPAPAVPPIPPVPQTAAPAAGIALPPGVPPVPTAAPAPAAPIVPPTPVVQPQAPSMPAPPPPSADGSITLAEFRDSLRDFNTKAPGITFRVMKAKGWYTPEAVPADQYGQVLQDSATALAALP